MRGARNLFEQAVRQRKRAMSRGRAVEN